MQIGGLADCVYFPETEAQLMQLVRLLGEQSGRYHVLGGGSNVIIPDVGLRQPVICLQNLNQMRFDPENLVLHCNSGVLAAAAADEACRLGLGGLTFMHLLPGTVGGACYMNARAFGSSQSDVLKTVSLIDEQGCMRAISNSQCEFDYKRSIFQSKPYLIASVAYQLFPQDNNLIAAQRDTISAHRQIHHHFAFPTFGCAFLNDYSQGTSTGKIIDSVGLKGLRVGGAMVSLHHANFIVNVGGATAADVVMLIAQVKERVFQQTGVTLQMEVKLIAEKLKC